MKKLKNISIALNTSEIYNNAVKNIPTYESVKYKMEFQKWLHDIISDLNKGTLGNGDMGYHEWIGHHLYHHFHGLKCQEFREKQDKKRVALMKELKKYK